jgi:long-chain acyl-CoA synthetase
MISKSEIIEKYDREIETANKFFAKWEQVKRYKLLGNSWGIETGELTPTMKLKRKVIHKKYESEIEGIYKV